MRDDSSNNKKITHYLAFAIILVISIFILRGGAFDVAHAEPSSDVTEEDIQNSIGDILGSLDTNAMDDYLSFNFDLNFLSVSSFKDFVLQILSGSYFDEYDSLFSGVVSIFKENLKGLSSVFFALLVLILLYEIFINFCPDKYSDFKKSIKIVFSLMVALILTVMFKDIAGSITSVVNKIFNFSNLLFPILLNLILLSGATGTHSVYSSLTAFILNTGSYIFVYVLLPVSISILLLSVIGSAFSSKRFSFVIDILKSIFKYVLAIFFGLFGVLSAVNLIISGASDGVSLKLTKYAIKNYIPFLGGYISDGFDFVHTCSILVKNAFGVCGIFVLLFIVLQPLIIYFIYILMFKVLAALVSFTSDSHFASVFNNISKCMSYFVAILVGIFLIFFIFIYLLIMSVSII